MKKEIMVRFAALFTATLVAVSTNAAIVTIENVPLVGGVQATTGAAIQAYDDVGNSTQGGRGGQQFTTPGDAASYDLLNIRLFLANAVNLNEAIPHFLAVYDGDPTVAANLVGISTNSIQPDTISAHNVLPFAEPLDWAFAGLNLNPSTQYSAIFSDNLGAASGGIKIRVDDGNHYAGGDSYRADLSIGIYTDTDAEFIVTLDAVPEPGSLILLSISGLIIGCFRRMR